MYRTCTEWATARLISSAAAGPGGEPERWFPQSTSHKKPISTSAAPQAASSCRAVSTSSSVTVSRVCARERRSHRGRRSRQVDPDALDLSEQVEVVATHLAPEA